MDERKKTRVAYIAAKKMRKEYGRHMHAQKGHNVSINIFSCEERQPMKSVVQTQIFTSIWSQNNLEREHAARFRVPQGYNILCYPSIRGRG